jgi:hypothetical protein
LLIKSERAAVLLRHHPVGGRLLRVPGLEQLLGQPAQLLGISGCINGAIESLNLKLLTNTQIDLRVHLSLVFELVKR